MLQNASLTPEDYRGDRFGDHTHDVTGDPDLLNLTRPDVILDVHRQYLAAGADITTTNTFTATSIGQADYGLQEPRPRDERRGRPARPPGRRRGGRQVRRRLDRPAQRHAVAVAEGRGPGVPRGHVRPGQGLLRGADRGARRGRRRPAADRDDLRHAQLQGRRRRRPRGRARPAAVDLGHHRRPVRPHAVRPDRRGVLAVGRAREAAGRRRELLAGRRGDAPARRRAGPARRHLRRLPPQRRPAQRVRRLRPDARRRPARCSATSPATGMVNIVGGCCGTTPAAHREDRRGGARARPAARCRTSSRGPGSAGLEPFEIGAGHRVRDDRRADQRHRLREVPPAHRGRRPPGRRRRRARPGARRREPAGRQHGRRPARQRAGDDHVPEPDRDRARGGPDPGHGRQFQVDGARSRPEVPAGQGSRQLDLPQGGRGAVPRRRRARSATTARASS